MKPGNTQDVSSYTVKVSGILVLDIGKSVDICISAIDI